MKEQILIEGWESVSKIAHIIKRNHYNKVFLVTGKESFQRSGAKKSLEAITELTDYCVFNDFEINPKFEDVQKGLLLFHDYEPDLIIAVGGGTVLDMAKLINCFADLDAELEPYIRNEKKIIKTAVPMIAIPTTAGTGSEATHFAVVYFHGLKYSVAHETILPDYVVLDPSLTLSAPKYVTACTAMDALCQGIESFWSGNSNSESIRYAEKAITLAINSIEDVVNKPEPKSREAIQKAAYYAGKAINISKTTAAHAFSYYITSNYGIPHGHAVGIMIGWVFKQNLLVNEENCNDVRGVEYVQECLNKLCKILNFKEQKSVEASFNALLSRLCLETDDFVLSERTLKELFQHVNVERLKNNPVKLAQFTE